MGLVDIIKKGTFFDILKGMSVTGTYFVKDKVTVEYPKEKLQTYPRFRGVQALLTYPDTGEVKCVACMLCATICPSQCIRVVGEQTPEGRSRPATFDLDLTHCVFCGLCEEVCPEAAIVMTRQYELATYDKTDLYLTKEKLVANQRYALKETYVQRPTAAATVASATSPSTVAAPSGEAAGLSEKPTELSGDDGEVQL